MDEVKTLYLDGDIEEINIRMREFFGLLPDQPFSDIQLEDGFEDIEYD